VNVLPVTDRDADGGAAHCARCGAAIDADTDIVWAEAYTPHLVDGARGAETVYRPEDVHPFHRTCMSWDDQDYRIVDPPR
jgi:hypothetical protein